MAAKKALNVIIKNLRYFFLIGVIAFGLITIVGTGGGGGGGIAPPSYINGRVTEAHTGDPIQGARIKSNYGYSATSLSDGYYLMLHPSGIYTLTVSASGFASITRSGVVVPEGGTVTHNFELTTNTAPDRPILLLPTNDETDVSLTPELKTEDFNDTDLGDIHTESQWQIGTASDFSALVLDVTSTSHLTSLIAPDLILNIDTTYYWRARFYDSQDEASEWADPYSFTTVTAVADDTDSNGIPDDQEVDSTVDLDNDGTFDISQGDIKCVNTLVGDGQMGVQGSTNVTSIDSLKSIDPDTISDTENKPNEMPLGLISFKLTVDSAGDTAEATVYLSEAAPSGARWYKYDSINGWQDYSDYAGFSSDMTSVTLSLTDGGIGDADGTANGVIVDPSGPSSGNGGGGSDNDGNVITCFIATTANGSSMEDHLSPLSIVGISCIAQKLDLVSTLALIILVITGLIGFERFIIFKK